MIRATIAALVVALPAHAADFTAKPRHVGDGDTVSISLRAKGIDAPELHQQCQDARGRCYACGRVAKDALTALLGKGAVSVKVWDTDRYGRPVVTLYANGKDIHLEMIRQGQASCTGSSYRTRSRPIIWQRNPKPGRRSGEYGRGNLSNRQNGDVANGWPASGSAKPVGAAPL
jgi:endonuclease YncB( thermonuclease family)